MLPVFFRHDLAIFIFGQRGMVVIAAITTSESLILSSVITEFCQVVFDSYFYKNSNLNLLAVEY